MRGDIIHHYVLHPTIIWDVTTFCNYKCTYCYSDHMPNRLLRMTDKYSLEAVSKAFGEHLAGWVVVYIGGEPFVFRDFAELNVGLTRTNKIGLYSNLSIQNHVRRFADSVQPDRVTFINCGFHAAERIERDPSFTRFVSLYMLLRSRGFPAIVTYIMHPTVVGRAPADIRQLAGSGVTVYLKVFRGVFEGRSYPEAYDSTTLAFIEEHEPGTIRGSAVRAQMSGEGCQCRAGMLLLDMDVDGNVYRCLTDRSLRRDSLGNLFNGSLRIQKGPTICRNGVCLSARQGMGFSLSAFRELRSPIVTIDRRSSVAAPGARVFQA
jgi:hypothetical protein